MHFIHINKIVGKWQLIHINKIVEKWQMSSLGNPWEMELIILVDDSWLHDNIYFLEFDFFNWS